MSWQWERVGKGKVGVGRGGAQRVRLMVCGQACAARVWHQQELPVHLQDHGGSLRVVCSVEAFDWGRGHWWDRLQEGSSSLPACRDPDFACRAHA